jgi:hypothetical protein
MRSRAKSYGAPSSVDPLEGWIADPSLLRGVVPGLLASEHKEEKTIGGG